jgi:hypothetical protein
MADRVLFIGWGNPIPGREERGLEVFTEALGILGRRQQEGQIEKFDVLLLKPNTVLNGCISIEGTVEQIDALQEDEEFRRNTVEANLVVEGLCHLEGFANEGVSTAMDMYREAAAKVPQTA